MTKKVLRVQSPPPRHWVGDGFHVMSVIEPRYGLSPFILFDFGSPEHFDPTSSRRGVGPHPHRGFETVTVVYQGEVAHRDSAGNSGLIGPGDVQWMTAASGVLHEELHSEALARSGGTFEMAQIWVNLPSKHKMSPPKYQTLLRDGIPSVPLEGGTGTVRVIGGSYRGVAGAAATFTPVDIWDLTLRTGASTLLPIPEGHSAALFVRSGALTLDGGTKVAPLQLAILDRRGADLLVRAESPTEAIVLAGEPIDEPVAHYGPFVMNSQKEIVEAIEDFQSGRMGTL